MKAYISKNSLSRKLGMALVTLDSRLAKRGILPDAVCVNQSDKPDTWLFDHERLPTLRAMLTCNQPTTES